jgi:NAD(P)-dependent dehydrogenase (short-subunit alcohol dehydrogenase family)
MAIIEEIFGLKDKVAVVTGGGGVLPGAMAAALIKAGARVCLWGRGRHSPMDQAVQDMIDNTGIPDGVIGLTVDAGNEKEVKKALKETEDQIGIPTILINGVGGIGNTSAFIDIDMELFNKTLQNNLFAGCVIPTKVFSCYWIDNYIKGAVINIASMASFLPMPGIWAYDAAKAGVMNITKAAASELSAYNIRVNAIAPGFFMGKQNKHLLVQHENPTEYTNRGKAILGHIPLKRFGDSGELEGVTLLLASNKASGYMTGVCIPVDGGYLSKSI